MRLSLDIFVCCLFVCLFVGCVCLFVCLFFGFWFLFVVFVFVVFLLVLLLFFFSRSLIGPKREHAVAQSQAQCFVYDAATSG